jgi:hypothetical protein
MARAKMSTVKMINSVGEHVAGEKVKLPPEEADRFIILGYAEGELSREFSEEERAAFQSRTQEVSV